MTFTTTPPTTPGFYAWRLHSETSQGLLSLFNVVIPKNYQSIGGEWCRLVPAEEVEAAYREGYNDFGNDFGDVFTDWNNSRAKRIAEGKE